MPELLDEDQLREEIDAGVYREQKNILRNRVWMGYFLIIIGFLTSWLIIGLFIMYKGMKMSGGAKDRRKTLEQIYDDYQVERNQAGNSS